MKAELKKFTSILLTVMLVVGAITVLPFTASAAVDAEGRYYPGENVTCGTNRYYFYMPHSWRTNDQVNGAGVYWFGGTDACSMVDGTGQSYKWPGYKMQKDGSVEDLYYVDCPSDVETVIFNNFFDGGDDTTDPKYVQAVQTMNIDCSYYPAEDAEDEAVGALGDEDYIPYHQTKAFFEDAQAKVEAGDTEALGQFADNFIESEYGFAYTYSNMIFIVDSANTVENELNGKTNYVGYWYFYYGDGTYGTRLTPEEAEAAGELYSFADRAELDIPSPVTPPAAEPTEPAPGSADSGSGTGAGNVISFDLESSGWKNVKKVYCHIWRADGTGDWPSWTTRAEQCTDNGDGTWSYDLSKTGNDIKKTDGKIYCVIFAADTGMQTYNMIMSGACIGDTAYCTGEKIENPEDSEKTAIIAAWRNNKDCGAEKKITSTGKIVGSVYPDGENDVTLLADYLYAYNADPAKMNTSLVQNLFNTLHVSVPDVMAAVKAKAAGSYNEYTIISNVEAVLKDIKDPTTSDSSSPKSVKLNKSSITLGVGESYTLTKTVSPSNASTSYYWGSSNASVATVDSSGKITAKATGTAEITVMTSNGKTATCKVTVKKAPTSVSLNKTSITLGVGETYDLNSKLPSGTASYSVKYSSNKTSVATVKSAGGLVTAKAVGTATITAKTYNGKTATCKVTVKKAPTSVSLNKTSITLGVGESYTLTKTVSPSNASTSYYWGSSNASVATVDSSGKITAKGTGTANITVKTSNGKTATCKVTVKKAPSKVSLNKTSITLGVGETYDLNSKLPSGCASYSVTYSSNKTSVATVKAAGGLVTAKAVGTATITAKTYNGKKATCTVTVKNAPTSVSLNKTSVTLKVGQTYDLNSKLPSGCASYSIKYTSNNSKVATVKAAGGLVTAKAKGTATITATTYNGKKATCKVTVK